MEALSRVGVARTLSHIPRRGWTHTLPSVEQLSNFVNRTEKAKSAADCLYASGLLPEHPECSMYGGVTHPALGTAALTRVPRIQACCPTSDPSLAALAVVVHVLPQTAGLDSARSRAWD